MTLDEKIKEERKFSRYGILLFAILMILNLIAYFYEKIMGYPVEFPYLSIIMCLFVIFCFRYTYSLVYLFKCLNRIEEREIRKAVREKQRKQAAIK